MTMKAAFYPIKLLMTADAVGGVWTYALELARAVESYGIEVALAVMGPLPSAAQRREASLLPNVTLHESSHALEWMHEPWRDVDRAGEWLLEIAAAFEPDLIHLNGYAHASLPWDAPVLVAAHSCVFSWRLAVEGKPAGPYFREYQRRVAEGLRSADVVAAPSAAMLRSLADHYGPVGQGRVIHNARDPKGFFPAPKTPRIFSAGRAWDQAKNLGTLDAVAPRVRWPIYLAGDCQHPNGEISNFDNVRCLGKLDTLSLSRQLAKSAIYALPALYEPFGLSALEAALCGCALVLGDIPSLREVWGDTAVFVQPGDEQALANALNALIDHDGRRVDLGRRARARALQYTPSRMAEQYIKAYRQCLNPRPLEVAA